MIRHLVALRFKAGTPDDVKQGLMDDLGGLDGRIDGILDFRASPNISVEDPLVRGYRDLFWFDFRDASVRDAYLADEMHQRIGARLVAELEGGSDGVFVLDFEM
ncbi:MAG: Dabb family protein [Boseongicola sp. SB0676_bin_33]|uniref:Dabb family protein n=1 Tax=Boseongicola sp. SB0664_bin_43 TaxID=2604844 RepID=A0A6B0Y670_9RHOB|nr:Dabb family protein [Boseongicola sp. SB0664_bin_43]MYF88175.1 Dabb family protein [Boseongicola sp. SB0676_bin_33]